MANTSENLETDLNVTGKPDYEHARGSFFISLLVWGPGIIFNTIALIFIIKDMRKAMFPALILLLLLCIFDSSDIWGTVLMHILAMFMTTTDVMCAIGTFLFNYFAIAAGVINSFLAIDRFIAIGHPFFYQNTVTTCTTIKVCLIAGFLIGIFCVFPMIGLGDIWTYVGDIKVCMMGYRKEPIKRVFGMMFGLFEVVFLVTLIVCNVILIKNLLKMRNKIVVVMPSSSDCSSNPSSEASKRGVISPVEVVFAKLMIALSLAYLVLGTPARVVIMLGQFNVRTGYAVVGIAHSLNGYLRVVNPIIYILIRKVDRKKLFRALCRCIKRRESQ